MSLATIIVLMLEVHQAAVINDEQRAASLDITFILALAASKLAGVTRLGDLTQFGCDGIPVFQAIRPASRSLTVSQGKGLSVKAAKVSALLEAAEYYAAEELPLAECFESLEDLPEERSLWAGKRDELAINLDPSKSRGWVDGIDLLTGNTAKMPWDLLSLDFAREPTEVVATSVGLATGNTRIEALCSGVAELLEHDLYARFRRLSAMEKLGCQLDVATIDDPVVLRVLGRITFSALSFRIWSIGHTVGVACFRCTIFPRHGELENVTPVSGSGCHSLRSVALLRAVLEAVQGRATLMAGARDDVLAEDYLNGDERTRALLFVTLAFGEGQLAWRNVPDHVPKSSDDALDFLLARTQKLADTPILAFDHRPIVPGLHISHVLAPGMLDRHRLPPEVEEQPTARYVTSGTKARSRVRLRRPILFAGPSIASLKVPDLIELKPPAVCGDLAALLDDPPAVVGLADGYFNLAPTVWHKEILGLLAAGTRVVGGASLGALRAAELDVFGMEGVGEIYRAYRDGTLVRDDAVMLLHAPATLRFETLTIALVDAERALIEVGLEGKVLRMMQRIVRTTPYDRRTWRHCIAEFARRTGRAPPVSAEALERVPSVKVQDAARLIDRLVELADVPADASLPAPPPLTHYYRQLLAKKAPATCSALTGRTPGLPLD
jgi:YcaO-like protein with predicted kinase domain